MTMEIERVESYQIDEDNFTKEYLVDGQVRFRKNGEVLSLTAWNWEINRSHSMELKEKHPNALVRWLEAYRRRGFLGLIDSRGSGAPLAQMRSSLVPSRTILVSKRRSSPLRCPVTTKATGRP